MLPVRGTVGTIARKIRDECDYAVVIILAGVHRRGNSVARRNGIIEVHRETLDLHSQGRVRDPPAARDKQRNLMLRNPRANAVQNIWRMRIAQQRMHHIGTQIEFFISRRQKIEQHSH